MAKTGDQIDQDSRSASHGAATSLIVMASIESVTLEVADPTAVNRFYAAALRSLEPDVTAQLHHSGM